MQIVNPHAVCFLDSPEKTFSEINRILSVDGILVVGLVLRESPWGRFYRKQKEEGHPFYRLAKFLSYTEIEKMLLNSGFFIDRIISTLFQEPEKKIVYREPARDGYWPKAGFTVIVARKLEKESEGSRS